MDFEDILSVSVPVGGVLISAVLVWYQLLSNQRWNRKKTTQELCDRFLEKGNYDDWENIESAIAEEEKKYYDLTQDEQKSVRRLLGFFENFSVFLNNGIVDWKFFGERFSGIIPHLYNSSIEFILSARKQRNDEDLYSGFLQLSYYFNQKIDSRFNQEIDPEIAKAAKQAHRRGRLKGHAQIIEELGEDSTASDSSGGYSLFLVVDIQRDFFPGGALSVPDSESLIPPLNAAIAAAESRGMVTVLTRDWHPADHPTHFGEHNVHGVADTPGAQFYDKLQLPENRLIVDFGVDPNKDGYSPFENPALGRLISSPRVEAVYVAGLALEFCVQTACLGALQRKKRVIAVGPLIRGVDVESQQKVKELLIERGVDWRDKIPAELSL